MGSGRTSVVVVGGGVAGLSAAYLLGEHPSYDVTVLEGSPLVGGRLRTAEVAGVTVDVGAEAMLNRRPEAVGLARELGLDLVHPATISSAIWTRGRLRPMPSSVMGVPTDLDQLAASGILSDEGLRRVRSEASPPPTEPDSDVSVASLVGSRLGDEVVDRLVEPLLGGVYAGHASLLSARATVPQVVALLDRDPSLLRAAAASSPPQATATGGGDAEVKPVFAGLVGGVGRLPQALVGSGRFVVRTGTTVRELRRVGPAPDGTVGGFELVVGSTRDAEVVRADKVVLATPAAPTARLLADLAPGASAALAEIEYASMAVVTLAFDASGVPALTGSGFLVPPVDGRRIKASTFSFNKWPWVRAAGRAEDVLLLRTSIGRHREEHTLQVPDDELVRVSLEELGAATGLHARPVDVHVQRWGGGLPQYAVGHLDRVARVRDSVAQVPGLAVCGAAYDGIGIPACIASARDAVDRLGTR